MKKLYLLFIAFLLSQLDVFAQGEFFNNEPQQIISFEQLADASSVNIDSLMLDSIITAFISSENIPGAASIIMKDNKVIWNKNYGYKNLQFQLPVEDSTLFLMASISKTFMATAIMQLWENGLIDLEGNINNYMPAGLVVVNPYFPSDIITVKMVMTHTSSLNDNFAILDPLTVCGDSPIRLDTFLVNYFTLGGTYYSSNNFYNYHPGQAFNYCNVASCLLALIVENLSGKSFDEYCRDSIFIPLSMNSTSWFLSGMDTTKIATPYINNPPTPICHQGFPDYTDGQLRTNKLELLNYLSAYMNGGIFNNNRILDSATISMMLTDQCGFVHLWGGRQGLIWFSYPALYRTVWGHAGGWYGTYTYMFFHPQENWGFNFFINWASPPNYAVGFHPTAVQIAKYAHLFGNIYALRHSVDKTYARKNIDPVLFRTKFSNTYNHPFISRISYADLDSTQIDSLTLFDDGLHGDSLANDGIYANYIPPRSLEDYFTLSVSTIDNQTNKYFNTPDINRFTTVGPVVLDSIYWTKIPNNYSIKPFVKNESAVTTITNPSIRLMCNDPWVTSITPDLRYMPSIPPGVIVSPALPFTVTVDTLIFPNFFNFKVEVMKDGRVYWTDTMRVIVGIITGVEEELPPLIFSLEQNYPNPFNPVTTIKYSIPEISKVSLVLFNLLGEEVTTLVNEEKVAGYYTVEFNAANLPSGVYFYQIKAGQFVETKKMILIK